MASESAVSASSREVILHVSAERWRDSDIFLVAYRFDIQEVRGGFEVERLVLEGAGAAPSAAAMIDLQMGFNLALVRKGIP